MGKKEESLEAQIQKLQTELKILKSKKEISRDIIRSLADISDQEKIFSFDILYSMALETIEEGEEEGYFDREREHFIWESVMELLVGQDDRQRFWNYYNSLA